MTTQPQSLRSFGANVLVMLREAPWLTADRARAYGRIFIVLTLACIALWIAFSHGRLDPGRQLLGTDFASFWTASKLALEGHPEAVYDSARHAAEEAMLFQGAKPQYAAFFYPPVYLLYVLPLALLPYLVSLVLWLTATGALFLGVIRRYLKPEFGLLAAFAFPALLSNLGHGQNAFLSTALFGLAILSLGSRPILAGTCIGALAFKPHLGILWPVALLATGRFKTFIAAGATALALVLASYLVFGAETWAAFFKLSALARATLEKGYVAPEKMASVFAAVRVLGGGVTLGYAAQILIGLLGAASLVHLLRARKASDAHGPAILCATLLATPFLLDYDLVLLAIPLAWLAREGVREGFRPWEKLILAIGFVLPLIARSIAEATSIPLTPFVVAALYACVLRRGLNRAHA
jgi:hypothetical protein